MEASQRLNEISVNTKNASTILLHYSIHMKNVDSSHKPSGEKVKMYKTLQLSEVENVDNSRRPNTVQ